MNRSALAQPCSDDHFWSRIQIGGADECWEWTGARSTNGYGNHNMRVAHRVAYEKVNGPAPDGLVVMHSCDNPPCCNPSHLSLGTTRENAIDMAEKGRYSKAGVVLAPQDVAEIRAALALLRPRKGRRELAQRFGIRTQTVRRIERGLRYARV